VLEYFRFADVEFDKRMQDTINIIIKKRTKEGAWKMYANYLGQVHFNMEISEKQS
jgi:hypothetical protein